MAQLGIDFDLLVTAAEAGSYKPAPGHWLRFGELTGANPNQHVHVAASLFHDIAPAHELGIPAVWINRRGDLTNVIHSLGSLPRAAELSDLASLPDVLDRLVRERN